MRRPLLFAACFLALGCIGSTAKAAYNNAPYNNTDGSVYIPPGLNDGEIHYYRLIFVTDTAAPGTNSSFGFYDTFVKDRADLAGSLVQGLTWEAIVSLDDTQTALSRSSADGFLVYGTDGTSAGVDYNGLFDTGAGTRNFQYNQFGQSEGRVNVWTGSTNTI